MKNFTSNSFTSLLTDDLIILNDHLLVVLDDGPQIRLSTITPEGTTELPEHLELRHAIRAQQEQLKRIHDITVTDRSDQTSDPKNPVKSVEVHRIIENCLSKFGLDRYGITPLIEEFTFKNSKLLPDEKRLIIIPIPMSYESMVTAPSVESATEIFRSYKKGGDIVLEITRELRNRGIRATGHHPLGDTDEYHQLLFPPHAVTAGLGERGRTGLIIDYKYGPLVRLAGITVAVDLEPIKGEKIGITEFCHRCRYCVDYCPPRALPEGKYIDQFLSGKKIDFKIKRERCFKYFEKHQGCGRCIVHCILAEPDLDKVSKRMDRIANWYQKWIVTGELQQMYEREIGNISR